MSAIRVPGIVQNTDEWLAFRRQHLGGSDAPVIAGETGSLFELVSEKRGLIPRPERSADMQLLAKFGHLIEDDMMAIYPDLTSRAGIRLHGACLSAQWPVASCSPDGEARRKGLGERRGIQTKMSRSQKWPHAMAMGDLVPGDVYAQVQHEMYVMEWDVEDVLVLLYGSPKVIEVPRSDAYIDNLLYFEREAWTHVEAGTLPDPDGSEATRKAIAALHPADTAPVLARTSEFEELARQLKAVQAELKEAEGLEGSIKNAVRLMIGDAAGVEGCWSYKSNRDSTKTDYAAAVEAAQSAGIDLAAYIAAATTVNPGARVLRVTLKESAA